MDAKINDAYECTYNWDHLSERELQLLNTKGIELNIDQLEKCIQPDGSFEWKGQKVIVYIKDQWAKSFFGKSEYKYHIANCRTQVNMKLQGRINRYVISTRKDGLFEINLRDGRTRTVISKNVEKPMNICMNCLSTMLMSHPSDYQFFNYNNFNLERFLKTYTTKIKSIPQFSNKTVPDDEYPDNWATISKTYRKSKNWECEDCGSDCSMNRSFLHCHHKGPKYDNNFDSLEALCKNCHRKRPGHQSMK